MWSYNEHQIKGAEWSLNTVRKYGLAYLSWQERTRKTGTALLTVENSKANQCLIITKKTAMDGWEKHFRNLPLTKKYVLINYESAHKIKSTDFEFVILDEAHHAISSTGKTSKTWKTIRKYTKGKAILYLSATPYAEHLGLIYHQLKMSDYTPFRGYKNFYEWFRMFGIPNMTRTPYGLVETYTKYKDELILKSMDHLFDFKTRQEVGIKHEPVANLVIVPMGDYNKGLLKELDKHSVIEIDGEEPIICDTPMKERMVHYQIEGGTIKTGDKSYVLTGQDKINYIRENYDEENIGIMAHFVAERLILEEAFPKAKIYSADGHAEGVDLSDIDKLIVYSMSQRTSKYAQRLARQANHDRMEEIIVDILVSSMPGIGHTIYESVALKKENFDKNSYERFKEGL